MDSMATKTSQLLNQMLERVNRQTETPLRLANWSKSIQWVVDGNAFYWEVSAGNLHQVETREADIVLNCTCEMLAKSRGAAVTTVHCHMGDRDIQFQGSFADAYRLGYLFLEIILETQGRFFLTDCFLNINTRFPQGCAFAGEIYLW